MSTLNIDQIAADGVTPHDSHVWQATKLLRDNAGRNAMSDDAVREAAAKFVEAQASDGEWQFTLLPHGQAQNPQVEFEYRAH